MQSAYVVEHARHQRKRRGSPPFVSSSCFRFAYCLDGAACPLSAALCIGVTFICRGVLQPFVMPFADFMNVLDCKGRTDLRLWNVIYHRLSRLYRVLGGVTNLEAILSSQFFSLLVYVSRVFRCRHVFVFLIQLIADSVNFCFAPIHCRHALPPPRPRLSL